ncbi:maleylpyruvate isomerase family mycothiol-dependent enzyme [Amycolatopsis suaedae]|uniref:Maleylpyruvate isomerase family mycothiol-dependent enzyme n=1 Tax=Amycolatopsis suaedae TaxID=2510978 RepID=A0A4Q7J0L7_9PSEU|nr:maleylpyruvate isomerase family mycothiol-dependent enzyme [Amycolatopsis suaedae]RZQ59926.1 maleylpyruvate isomerase family mycothiol-dependent enzyme [Amycolatopsis suaedae]
MALTPAQLLTRIGSAHERLRDAVAGLTDERARGASELPDWTRGHVLTHLAELSAAFLRQTEYAVEGRLIEVYDGGRPARAAAIEAGAGRPAAQLAEAVTTGARRLATAWAAVDGRGWARPVTYRDGVLLDIAFCWWREVNIHLVDADLGYRPSDWSPEFCGHALDFLAPRSPDGVRLVLRPDGGEPGREWGSGPAVVVAGALTDLTAWLAGRRPDGPLLGRLPELGPWP